MSLFETLRAHLSAHLRRRPAAALVACLAAAGLTLASCSSGGGPPARPAVAPPAGSLVDGGTITWAEQPLAPPDYIFPINACCMSAGNIAGFQQLMYRPLYWFGSGEAPLLDEGQSLARPPTFRGDSVVIDMKTDLVWSDGEPVDAADVVLFMNMLQVVKRVYWGEYEPGFFPDNVADVTASGKYQVTFQLTGSFNPTWFTYDELSQITPLPLAWDVTHRGGPDGSGGCSSSRFEDIATTSTAKDPIVASSPAAARCLAVFEYLANPKTGQAADLATYGSNPLWATVDGPFRLASFDPTSGDADFVPNPRYRGPRRARVAHFDEIGYPSDNAEYEALLSGDGPDIGYIPVQDLPPNRGRPTAAGPNTSSLLDRYYLVPAYPFQIDYAVWNLANPSVGPLFRQAYVRRAMQSLVDQPAYVREFDGGYAVPTTGPVPLVPSTYASTGELHDQYPYSVSRARSLLASHGWKVVPGGASYCVRPGTGAGECGAGIRHDERLSFTLQWSIGVFGFSQQMATMRAAWEKAGIHATLRADSFSQLTDLAGSSCEATHHCSWEMADWGSGWQFAPDYYPTGEDLFFGQSGCSDASQLAISNSASYCDGTNDSNIDSTIDSSSPTALARYENYLAAQVPVLWQPVAPVLYEVSAHLGGVAPLDVLGNIDPEYWGWQRGFVSNS